MIAGGSSRLIATFRFCDLPETLREQAVKFLSPDEVARYTSEPIPAGRADRPQFEIEYVKRDQVEKVIIDEAACVPEILDLIDDLISIAP